MYTDFLKIDPETEFINFNKFYNYYNINQVKAKMAMVQAAAAVLADAYAGDYYKLDDLYSINYSEVTGWLGWPDFQDNGIFEQVIDTAADVVLSCNGYKTRAEKNK